ARMAAEHFLSQGVDILSYNSVESADDIEDLRRALGAERLNIVGFSYGTHLELSVIRRHGARLDRAVLIGTEGQNHTLKLPSTSQRSLERLSKLVAADPTVGPKMPDLLGTLKRILDRLEKEPITVRVMDRRTRQPVDVRLGKFGFQAILVVDLGDTNDLPVFPALLYTVDRGDYSILAQFVEKRFNQYGRGVSIMSLVMDASSGATRDRHERILAESKDALLDNAMNFPFPEIGEVFGNPDLGDAYRSPIVTEVPTLFISGEYDNNTPPFQADEVRKGFKQSIHLIVENAGHESLLIKPQVQQAIVDYLMGKDVSKVRLAAPPLRFRPIPDSRNE
ncbi:MAG TPA: alpha/beta hydrolase, partial [Blastocatellia bacterium]|nr:alpha/beta hydrolase [Blastocatellia bacterium]